MATDRAAMAGIYAQRLIENEYVQENLAEAADRLRAAYKRASKRRVEPTRDKKLRNQIRDAALSLREATNALQSGRRKPKKRRGRRLVLVLILGAGAAAAIVASNEELRRKVLGGDSPDQTVQPSSPSKSQEPVAG